MNDELGDRMKAYEGLFEAQCMPRLPVFVRLDGRSFHRFTRHVAKPFSETLHRFMVETTKHLVVESVATVGYTQSDEITLCWSAIDAPFFDGQVQKMASTLAAMASVFFNGFSVARIEYIVGGLSSVVREITSGLHWPSRPTFDARVWQVPSEVEATNVFLWRQMDAARNSVQMAARHHLGHAKCQDKDSRALQEMLFQEHRINWADYPAWAKRGTFVKHARTTRGFTAEELADLPEKHHARANPEMVVERRVLSEGDFDLRSMTLGDRIASLFVDAGPNARLPHHAERA